MDWGVGFQAWMPHCLISWRAKAKISTFFTHKFMHFSLSWLGSSSLIFTHIYSSYLNIILFATLYKFSTYIGNCTNILTSPSDLGHISSFSVRWFLAGWWQNRAKLCQISAIEEFQGHPKRRVSGPSLERGKNTVFLTPFTSFFTLKFQPL